MSPDKCYEYKPLHILLEIIGNKYDGTQIAR